MLLFNPYILVPWTIIRELKCSTSLNDAEQFAVLKPSVITKELLQMNCAVRV